MGQIGQAWYGTQSVLLHRRGVAEPPLMLARYRAAATMRARADGSSQPIPGPGQPRPLREHLHDPVAPATDAPNQRVSPGQHRR